MFRLAHISDPHLSAVPKLGFVDLASKRLFGFYNWHRNRAHAFAPAVLSGLVADIHAAGPEHIAITGDLVNLGLESEFVAAAEWLRAVADAKHATLIPGNHDAYMPGSFAEFSKAWGDYMRGDDGKPGVVTFPFVRRRGPVALVGVSSAVATPPLMATGEVGASQAAALAVTLAALSKEGLFRVVLVHHSPIRGATSWYRRLVDARLFRRALAESGAELVLHGHDHRTTVASLPGRDGPVPVIGVAAASVLPHDGKPGGSYCLYSIETEGRFACAMVERGVRAPGGPVETLSERQLI
ncbi:MAG: metallophosphoesterase [Bauldia sp.]